LPGGSGDLARALPDVMVQTAHGKWSDLWVRSLSAAVLTPVALAALWFGGLAWAALVGLAMAGLGYEWARLAAAGARPRGALSWISVLLSVVWVITCLAGPPAALAALAVFTLIMLWLAGRFAAAGLPYAALGGISLLWLRVQPNYGFGDTLVVVAVIWGTDIGAYVVGRVIGGKKLAPRISPGKTWSGSIGGLLVGAVAGGIAVAVLHGNFGLAILIGACLSVAAQAGDLAESAIKRKLGVKDSGDTIPGHGGLFDRLDGFLAAAPLAVILLSLLHGGGLLWR
jgi:phosphatidate cytidylyltransferase